MQETIITEWVFLEINDSLRVSVRICYPEDSNLSNQDKINLAKYQYMRTTFQDVTRAA